ncbi:M20 family metallopeptidase [Neobittarella massiliensis]|uniref:N-formyl-4-amino-5-aminomethyl-2-methylpyrimidin e deformylase n=1 Tax=uncultured Anaerotruncus sp. TaxID=905011 RepID=A0A1C6JIS8_9FIRM|nr:ArgE/DapE family deacylase [Neobittarella massiliensis]SCJ81924.1 N-formyl-4-amino-5-aminomethyl-2-methylpyrimidin e deformylase [uncultured Anaerotruncus sp.]
MSQLDTLRQTLAAHREEYLDILKQLVRCDTQCIGHGILGGKERAGLEVYEQVVRGMGAQVQLEPLDEDSVQRAICTYNDGNAGHNYDDRYNVYATFGKSEPGKRSIAFNAHMDVMPVGELSFWESDPFDPVVRDGKLYGRGSGDDKGGIAAAVAAVKLLQDSGIEIPGQVQLHCVSDEEGGGNGSINAAIKGHRADACVICEATGNNAIWAHMGFVFFKVEVTGKSLHSAQKWLGVNAIEKAWKLVEALHELENDWLMRYRHPHLPSPSLNIGVIEGGTAGSTVPDYCSFSLCLHYIPGMMTHAEVIRQVEQCIATRAQGDSWLREHQPKVTVYQQGQGFEQDVREPFPQAVKTAMEQVLPGYGGQFIVSSSGCDARIYKNILGMPTLIVGPGDDSVAHCPNEYVPLDEWYDAILLYAQIILGWCS